MSESQPELVFVGSTFDEAEAARDAYFATRPHELARFDNNPALSIELRIEPLERETCAVD